MNVKVLIVIVVLLVALLVTGVVLGAGQDDGDQGVESPSWTDKLGELLVRKRLLQPEDVRGAIPPECAAQVEQKTLVLPAGSTCTLVIGSSSAPLRVLPLRLEEGLTAQVRFDPLEEDLLTAKYDLTADERETEVRIFKEGGTLEIACFGVGTACRLAVE